jgi:hypothetical protein
LALGFWLFAIGLFALSLIRVPPRKSAVGFGFAFAFQSSILAMLAILAIFSLACFILGS